MNCPSNHELQAICLDAPESVDPKVVAHIEHCKACQNSMEEFSQALTVSAQSLRETIDIGDSHQLRDRMAQLKRQRPSRERDATPQYQDLEPWIERDDSGIGRVGQYELVCCVGRGGMGVVFEAYDPDLQRTVALKMMSPALLVDQSSAVRFLREARAAAAISHPSVISIYSVSEVRNLPFLAMEFIEGDSLQAILRQRRTLEHEKVIEIATQLAEGLAAAHHEGVIHRDIKPANILIQKDTGKVVLLDFGLAHSRDQRSLTQTGTLLGTPEYLAPEQIHDEPVDHRCDLFSLGSVMYHMLAGKPPFGGRSVIATLNQVASAEPASLESMNATIPAWLCQLVSCLHAKNPQARLPNAESVATALRSRELSILPKSTSLPQKSRSKIIVVSALLIAFAYFATNRSIHSPIDQDSLFEADTSEQLMELLTGEEEQLRVRLISDEPYVLGPLEFDGQHVQIIAGEDLRASVVFEDVSNVSAIRCSDSHLEIDGVRLQVSDEKASSNEIIDDEHRRAIIACENAELILHDCELRATGRQCIDLLHSDAELSGVVLHAEDLGLEYEPSASKRLTISSSTIMARTAVRLNEPTVGSVLVNNSIFESDLAFEVDFHAVINSRVLIVANHNQFNSPTLLTVVDVEVPLLAQTRSLKPDWLPFKWQGMENDLPSVAVKQISMEGELIEEINTNDWKLNEPAVGATN